MSIIYESLKKIEKEGTTLQHSIPGIENIAKPKNGVPKRTKVILLCGIFCLAVIIIAAFSFKAPGKQRPKPAPPARIAAAEKQTGILKEGLPPLAAPKPLTPLILNGIFFSGESGYALVNNQIVKEGDMIEGVIVSKISEDTVELKNNEGIIKLSTQP